MRLVLDVDQRLHPQGTQPLRFLHVQRSACAARAAFVKPMRGDALFCHAVHLLGADLELDRRAQRAHQRGVQRLVAVALRDRDVVLEAAGLRLVQLVQKA